jgi:hypothetical protein
MSRATRTYDGFEYRPGARFRVLKEGCWLSGMVAKQGYHVGERLDLRVGDVIVCEGFGAGWGSDPGFGVHWTVKGMSFVMFYPSVGGAFGFRPDPECIDTVDESVTESVDTAEASFIDERS